MLDKKSRPRGRVLAAAPLLWYSAFLYRVSQVGYYIEKGDHISFCCQCYKGQKLWFVTFAEEKAFLCLFQKRGREVTEENSSPLMGTYHLIFAAHFTIMRQFTCSLVLFLKENVTVIMVTFSRTYHQIRQTSYGVRRNRSNRWTSLIIVCICWCRAELSWWPCINSCPRGHKELQQQRQIWEHKMTMTCTILV